MARTDGILFRLTKTEYEKVLMVITEMLYQWLHTIRQMTAPVEKQKILQAIVQPGVSIRLAKSEADCSNKKQNYSSCGVYH